VGWLERWDERNQRAAEYANLVEREDPNWWKRQGVVVFVYIAMGRVLHLIGTESWGKWVTIPVGTVMLAAFVAYCIVESKKRRARKARQAAAPPE
jgi:hypothetical protein